WKGRSSGCRRLTGRSRSRQRCRRGVRARRESNRPGLSQRAFADPFLEEVCRGHVDPDPENALGILLKTDQVKKGSPRFEVDQEVHVAPCGFVATRSGAEDP